MNYEFRYKNQGKNYKFVTGKDEFYFELKLNRVIKNINSIFGENCDPNLTNDGVLTYVNGEKQLFFDTLEITDYVNNQLSKNDQTKQYEPISSYTWIPTNRSYIAYKSDKIF